MNSVQSTSADLQIEIEFLRETTLNETLAIENASFPDEQQWSEVQFLEYGRGNNCVALIATRKHAALGLFFYAALSDHFLILNVAIRPDVRGQGIARKFIENLQRKTSKQRPKIVALVPTGLPEACNFFEHVGIEIKMTKKKGVVEAATSSSAASTT